MMSDLCDSGSDVLLYCDNMVSDLYDGYDIVIDAMMFYDIVIFCL